VTELDLSQRAALVLQRRAPPERVSGLSRDQGIAVVVEAVHRTRQRVLRRNLYVGCLTVTVTVAASALLWLRGVGDAARHSQSEVTAPTAIAGSSCNGEGGCLSSTAPEMDVAMANGEQFAPGSRLETALGEPRELALVSGTRLRVAGGSTLHYAQGDTIHRFAISRGHAEFSVAKQRAQERFLVSTPDAEIEVHGTVFEVALNERADSCGHFTAVTVSEGIVEVRTTGQRSFVTAGRTWPDDCKHPAPRQLIATRLRSNLQPQGAGRVAGSSATAETMVSSQKVDDSQAERATPPSSLAQQNRLYARATRALQRGSYDEAIALYDELAAKYPDGPLAASAAAARFRTLDLARKVR
jgi:hypothetical protein